MTAQSSLLQTADIVIIVAGVRTFIAFRLAKRHLEKIMARQSKLVRFVPACLQQANQFERSSSIKTNELPLWPLRYLWVKTLVR
jgi:hypothetical protein